MKKAQHTSKGIAQHRQLEICKTINISFQADNPKFMAFDPTLGMDYSVKITESIQKIESMPPDYVLVGIQMSFSAKIIKLTDSALARIRAVRYFIETAFPGEKFRMYEFGYPELKKVINVQGKFLIFLKSFNLSLIKYKTELTTAGMSSTIIDELSQLATDLDQANIDQEQAKKNRIAATGLRIKAYDDLWKLVGKVAKAGKILFESEPEMQRNYVLDPATKKKATSTETIDETSFLQGKITDTETKAEIEDVNVEVVNTDFKAITDENGDYYIDELPAATYSIKITAPGYKELIVKNIQLQPNNEDQEFNYELELLEV